MTERVVDLLEMIQVQNRDRERLAAATRAFDFMPQRELELRAVVYTGQAIVRSEVQQPMRATHDRVCEQHRGSQQNETRDLVDDCMLTHPDGIDRIAEVVTPCGKAPQGRVLRDGQEPTVMQIRES